MAADRRLVRRVRPGRRRWREALLGYALLAPSLAVFAVFAYYPFAKDFRLPFYRASLVGFGRRGAKRYVGWQQWREVLTGNDFRHSLGVTVRFVLLTVPAGVALGLLLAAVAHQRLRGIAIFRTIFSSTIATSVAVASLIFFSLTNPVIGVWNLRVGGIAILDNPDWALVAVAAVTVWQSLGLAFIVMSAGLQTIPDDLLEAARVDGASARVVFRRVTLPLLMPTIFFAFVVGSISAFQAFAQIELLTGGGPQDATRTLTFDIYDTAIVNGNANKAAVMAVGLFVVVLLLTLIQLRLERRVSYDR